MVQISCQTSCFYVISLHITSFLWYLKHTLFITCFKSIYHLFWLKQHYLKTASTIVPGANRLCRAG